MRLFYAFEFSELETTKFGEPNSWTKERSVKGAATAFRKKEERTHFLEFYQDEKKRVKAVTKKELRELCLGLSTRQFELFVYGLEYDMIEDEKENEELTVH